MSLRLLLYGFGGSLNREFISSASIALIRFVSYCQIQTLVFSYVLLCKRHEALKSYGSIELP